MGEALTDRELSDLWAEWRTRGDRKIRDLLICHYLPTVEFLAARLAPHVPPSYRPDLYGFGVMGLMDAVDKFLPEMGNRFETYGSQRIRGAMGDGVRTLNWLPRGASQRASRVIEKIVPVDFQSARNRSGGRLQDWMTDPADMLPAEAVELKADHEEVAEAVGMLNDQERTVITEHYYRHRKLGDIAGDFGVTESRICQIHRKALRLLEGILLQRRTA